MPNGNRSTPRKSRHRQNASGGAGTGHHGARTAAASDYESDAAHYMETRGPPSAPQIPHRTNTELNFSVLQRYLPSIRSIASIAANAVIYTFDPATQEWDKSDIQGTMFMCEQEPTIVTGPSGNRVSLPRSCVFVLNRHGLENVAIDLAVVSHCEVTTQLVILNLEEGAATPAASLTTTPDRADPKVIGLWIHADEDDTRETNAAIIQQHWSRVRAAGESIAGADHASSMVPVAEESVGPAMQAIGRKLSLSDLFGRPSDGAQDSNDVV